jgi:hypothetical protein
MQSGDQIAGAITSTSQLNVGMGGTAMLLFTLGCFTGT